jgi:hypothetical protein
MAYSSTSGYQARRLWIAVQVDLCTWQRVFAHSNMEYDTLFPSLLYTLDPRYLCIGYITR